ncbi:peptidyl-prolyl cis-trans isomerase-like 2 [Amniculicola lignicola CBS 123094]|uniref:Peptidyl-prolyl cis-trans isomerase-like 2 n=1 Tax=Amniculicola lignicola CBS 123094 TaxID=1392246 RepID=A0A6A5WJ27_9PLEO|nr:peptidyl-prolyl cis-trans isomerase-like 2 [Amniculicola lignicola CBS 123094]
MGKGTDKLYITHSEWASGEAHGNSRGATSKAGVHSSFKRLPFNYCAVSLQPFTDPVCTPDGTIFDLTHILTWLSKHNNTNPKDGSPLKRADLIALKFAKNDDGEYVDPVTFKVLTDNTHIITLRNTGNVYAYDTVERLNIKEKNWKDLVDDTDFSRKDIIVLQDPQNIESRDFGSWKHVQDGEVVLPESEGNVNTQALGNVGKIIEAKEALAKRKAAKANGTASTAMTTTSKASAAGRAPGTQASKPTPYNAAFYTSGRAAASFTSTGLTPHTSGERAILSDEEYMLKPKRVTQKGYARISTSLGELNIELLPEFAPKAVYNFVQLSKKGFYDGTIFHRNIRNFMIQGGDPTGTGRGGQSVWGKPFNDEFDGPAKHDGRGVISMANKGKNTNTSQFFIMYNPTPHLDRKHTIFGRVVGGLDTTLKAMENAEVESKEKPRPIRDIKINAINVFVDPFVEWAKERERKETKEAEEQEIKRQGGRDEDRTTWTGKRIRKDGTIERGGNEAAVGKYLGAAQQAQDEDEIVEEIPWDEEVPRKKQKTGGFGNFDGW